MKPLKTIAGAVLIGLCLASSAFAQYSSGSLYSAARNGDAKLVEKLLGEKPDKQSLNLALDASIAGGKPDLMKLLIKKGADVNHLSSFNNPILINAIMLGHFEAAKILIEAGANVNVKGYQTLDHGIEVTWAWTPLMCAARKGNLELAKLLVEKKAAINEKGWSQSNDDPETAIDIAAYSSNMDVFLFLAKKKAAISSSAIFKVARSGGVEILKLLLTKDVNINQTEPVLGRTLLAEASWWDYPKLVEFLISKGADVNKPDKKGDTPLMLAVKQNNVEVVGILFSHGADMNQENFDGETPFYFARNQGLTEILNIFRE